MPASLYAGLRSLTSCGIPQALGRAFGLVAQQTAAAPPALHQTVLPLSHPREFAVPPAEEDALGRVMEGLEGQRTEGAPGVLGTTPSVRQGPSLRQHIGGGGGDGGGGGGGAAAPTPPSRRPGILEDVHVEAVAAALRAAGCSNLWCEPSSEVKRNEIDAGVE